MSRFILAGNNRDRASGLLAAVKMLHNRHGRGDIRQVRWYLDGRVELYCQSPHMRPHVARGRVVGGRTVKLYRHQITVQP